MEPRQDQKLFGDEAVAAGGNLSSSAAATTATAPMDGKGGGGAAWGPVGPGGVSVRLRVRAQVDFGLGVFVVGSCPQLGSWRSAKAMPMTQVMWQCTDNFDNDDDNTWSVWECQVGLPQDSRVEYRYFLGKLVNQVSSTDQTHDVLLDLEVILWETNIQPRHLQTQDTDVDEMKVPLAEFGNYDGERTTSTGWLESHACIQLRLHSSAIFMLKRKHRQQCYSVKCFPVDYEPGLPTEDEDSSEIFTEDSSMDGPPTCTKTAVLFYNLNKKESRDVTADDLRPKTQPQQGCPYNPDDYLVFVARGMNQHHLGFQLDFMVKTRRAQSQLVGSAHLLPPKMDVSVFTKRVPIIGLNHRPIGEVQVEMLCVSPLPNHQSLMDVSYQNHWKWRSQGTTLNVGHRGMGSSYKSQKNVQRVTTAKENTVCSLHTAARHGADFVELDVLLSKDLVPVIYHDFDVCLFTPIKSKNGDGGRMVQVAIKDLTVEQLHSMKMFHTESGVEPIEITERKGEDIEDDHDEEPFPSLQSCLERVDPSVGFNIEIKFPQRLLSGECEQENFFDMNFFLDTILAVVLKYAGERKIIFSSFVADVCIMVGLKQNKYPVLLLSMGDTERYAPYKDWRAGYFQNGINFAKAEGMLGVDLHAEGVLKDLTLVPYIQALGLVVFVWGEDLNEDHVKNTLRGLNVDAIIFDRIGQNQVEPFTISRQTPSLELIMDNATSISPSSSIFSSRSFTPHSPSSSFPHSPSSSLSPSVSSWKPDSYDGENDDEGSGSVVVATTNSDPTAARDSRSPTTTAMPPPPAPPPMSSTTGNNTGGHSLGAVVNGRRSPTETDSPMDSSV